MKLVDEAVAVVIVNYRTPELTKTCVAALDAERASFRCLQVVLVDGGSGDDSAQELSAFAARREFRDWVTFLHLPLNGGFGWANNQAIHHLFAGGEPPEYLYLLNPDAEIEAGAVRFLAEYLSKHPRAAAVGSQLLEPDGSQSGSAFTFPSIRGEFSRGARTGALDRLFRVPPVSVAVPAAAEVDWVTGASVMLRADALREAGLFDEGFFLYHDELELMWRLHKAGWSIATEPRSLVRHVGGAATGVHNRKTTGRVEPRWPAYVYRSRSRMFCLTHGRLVATLAFSAWLAGHAVWRLRRVIGLGRGSKPIDHQVRDHLLKGFPRKHDCIAAVARIDSASGKPPAWMERGWL